MDINIDLYNIIINNNIDLSLLKMNNNNIDLYNKVNKQ